MNMHPRFAVSFVALLALQAGAFAEDVPSVRMAKEFIVDQILRREGRAASVTFHEARKKDERRDLVMVNGRGDFRFSTGKATGFTFECLVDVRRQRVNRGEYRLVGQLDNWTRQQSESLAKVEVEKEVERKIGRYADLNYTRFNFNQGRDGHRVTGRGIARVDRDAKNDREFDFEVSIDPRVGKVDDLTVKLGKVKPNPSDKGPKPSEPKPGDQRAPVDAVTLSRAELEKRIYAEVGRDAKITISKIGQTPHSAFESMVTGSGFYRLRDGSEVKFKFETIVNVKEERIVSFSLDRTR